MVLKVYKNQISLRKDLLKIEKSFLIYNFQIQVQHNKNIFKKKGRRMKLKNKYKVSFQNKCVMIQINRIKQKSK